LGAFLDDNDEWAPVKLELQLKQAEESRRRETRGLSLS
jgi:hypothetical protein